MSHVKRGNAEGRKAIIPIAFEFNPLVCWRDKPGYCQSDCVVWRSAAIEVNSEHGHHEVPQPPVGWKPQTGEGARSAHL